MFPRPRFVVSSIPDREYEVVRIETSCMGYDFWTRKAMDDALYVAKGKCEREHPGFPWCVFSESSGYDCVVQLPVAGRMDPEVMAAWRSKTAVCFAKHLREVNVTDVFGRVADVVLE